MISCSSWNIFHHMMSLSCHDCMLRFMISLLCIFCCSSSIYFVMFDWPMSLWMILIFFWFAIFSLTGWIDEEWMNLYNLSCLYYVHSSVSYFAFLCTQVIFLVKGPIYLVCISCTEEPYEALKRQLELIYSQVFKLIFFMLHIDYSYIFFSAFV